MFSAAQVRQRRHRGKIRTVGVAADAGGLERDAPGPAERIPHAGPVAEPPSTQFLHQFGQTARLGAQVPVDVFPGFPGRSVDLFRSATELQLLRVGHPLEDQPLQLLPLFAVEPFQPGFFAR